MDSLGDLASLVELARSWLIILIDLLQSLDFVIQLAVLSGSGTLAYLTARTLMRLLRSFLAATLPIEWAAGIAHVIGSIAMPGLWLLLLWIAIAISQFFGVGTGLPNVGTALLSAWVVIRLFANMDRRPDERARQRKKRLPPGPVGQLPPARHRHPLPAARSAYRLYAAGHVHSIIGAQSAPGRPII